MLSALLAWLLTGPVNDPVPVEVALAQAWVESRGETWPVSRAKGGRFCGLWQTQARSEAECRAMRSPLVAALAYRSEMTAWLRATGGDLRAALRGYGCGWASSRPGGQCRSYDVRVMRLASRLARRAV